MSPEGDKFGDPPPGTRSKAGSRRGAKPASESASATEAVLRFIHEGIRTGRLLPGQRLRERELIQQCSVSRSAVREALRTLAADGTIQVEHRRSAVVRQFTRREIWEQYQIREVLEGLAASLAASRVGVSGYEQELLELEKAMAQAASRNERDRYLLLNYELHRLIVRMSGNAGIQEHLDRAKTTQLRLQAARFLDDEWLRRSHADHSEIIHAILSGESAEAEAAMRRHIRGTRRSVHEMPESMFGGSEKSAANELEPLQVEQSGDVGKSEALIRRA
jgi:DNA-binding GntR family transcriptional regulator